MGKSGTSIPLKRKTNNTADLKMGRATRKRDIPCVVRALNFCVEIVLLEYYC